MPFKPDNIKKIDEPIGDDRAIFGLDNRHPMLSRDYPWAAIGRIEAVKADGKGISEASFIELSCGRTIASFSGRRDITSDP